MASWSTSADKLIEELEEVEKQLYQTKNQSPQDPLNFPIRLNNRLSSLVGVVAAGDNPPTRQADEVRDQLLAEIDLLLATQSRVADQGIASSMKRCGQPGFRRFLLNKPEQARNWRFCARLRQKIGKTAFWAIGTFAIWICPVIWIALQ